MVPTFIYEPIFNTLGFTHEHRRPDRDDYLVLTPCKDGICNPEYNDTICKNKKYAKLTANLIDTYNAPYDYCSVTHYQDSGTSSLGGFQDYCGLVPKDPVSCVINTRLGPRPITRFGQLLGLSELDIKGINKRYNCKESG